MSELEFTPEISVSTKNNTSKLLTSSVETIGNIMWMFCQNRSKIDSWMAAIWLPALSLCCRLGPCRTWMVLFRAYNRSLRSRFNGRTMTGNHTWCDNGLNCSEMDGRWHISYSFQAQTLNEVQEWIAVPVSLQRKIFCRDFLSLYFIFLDKICLTMCLL